MSESHIPIALGLGSNLGDSAQTLEQAVARLVQAGLQTPVISAFYISEPLGCVPGTPPFINAALIAHWPKSARKLLEACQRIERELGRPARHSSQESRTIDLDILLFGQTVLHDAELTIPHPRLAQRRFVLAPLAEIAPEWHIPTTGLSVRETLARLDARHPEGQHVQRKPGADATLPNKK
jgi:2-amino-4-hydroxy-6-hydroxymethyldihydropteridine diphosphokinase